MTPSVPVTRRVVTPKCSICGRWNDPTGGPEAHSGGCPEEGQPYPGSRRCPSHPWLDYGQSATQCGCAAPPKGS